MTATQEVRIQPTLKRKLLNELNAYAVLDSQVKAIKEAMEMHRATVERYRQEIGAEAFEVDGFKIAYVQGVRSVLDKHLLMAQGVTMAQIENASPPKPVKAYTKISLPGAKEYGGGE